MPMTDTVAALRIARDLSEAEAVMDQAMLAVAKLATSLVEARSQTASPHSLGHTSIMRLTKAQGTLVATKGDILRVHGELIDIARERAGGDVHENCKPSGQADTAVTLVA